MTTYEVALRVLLPICVVLVNLFVGWLMFYNTGKVGEPVALVSTDRKPIEYRQEIGKIINLTIDDDKELTVTFLKTDGTLGIINDLSVLDEVTIDWKNCTIPTITFTVADIYYEGMFTKVGGEKYKIILPLTYSIDYLPD